MTTEPDEVKQRDLWITDFVPMQNIYKLALALTSKEIGNVQPKMENSAYLYYYHMESLEDLASYNVV